MSHFLGMTYPSTPSISPLLRIVSRVERNPARPPENRSRRAFTLVELLVVIGIIVLMMGLMVPAFNAIKGGGDVNKALSDIAGTLEQARAYAMANNTYVFVGIAEVDASVDASVKPQVTATSTTGGRVALAVIAAKDGTRGYDPTNASLSNPAWTNYNNGAKFSAISKLQHFENLHLAPLFSTIPNSGNTKRPTVSSGSYQLGNITSGTNPSTSVTPFDWPLGSAIAAGQYSFKRVINFDPQGVARIQYSGNTDDINSYMEIGLQPMKGNAIFTASTKNVAAIQINCITGSIAIYRP